MTARAKDEGITITNLIRKAVEMYLSLDQGLIENVERLAPGLGLNSMELIQNMAIATFAMIQAHLDVRKIMPPDLEIKISMWETGGGEKTLITGNALYKIYHKRFTQKFEAEGIE